MTNFSVITSCFVLARDPPCFKIPLQTSPLPFIREGRCWPAVKGNAGSDKSWSAKLHWVLGQVSQGRSNRAGKVYIFPGSFGIPLQSFFKPALMFLRIRSMHESTDAIQRTLLPQTSPRLSILDK